MKMKKNNWIACIFPVALLFACNGNANGSIKSGADTSADTIGKHAPYGKDTFVKKQMDSMFNKKDSLH
jgi:hypothetical protein